MELIIEQVIEILKEVGNKGQDRSVESYCWCPLSHLTELTYFEEFGHHTRACWKARELITSYSNQ